MIVVWNALPLGYVRPPTQRPRTSHRLGISFLQAFGFATKILLVMFVVCTIWDVPATGGNIRKCWDTWSRCTRWSSGATGILWQSCNDRCRCKGRGGGRCVLTPSQCPLSNEAWQCQCYGSYGNPKPGKWCGF